MDPPPVHTSRPTIVLCITLLETKNFTQGIVGYYPDSSSNRVMEVVHHHCGEAVKPLPFLASNDDKGPPALSIDVENGLVGIDYKSKNPINPCFPAGERQNSPNKLTLYCLCLTPTPLLSRQNLVSQSIFCWCSVQGGRWGTRIGSRSDGIRTSTNADGTTIYPWRFPLLENTLSKSHPQLSTELLHTCKSGQVISAYHLP